MSIPIAVQTLLCMNERNIREWHKAYMSYTIEEKNLTRLQKSPYSNQEGSPIWDFRIIALEFNSFMGLLSWPSIFRIRLSLFVESS